MTLGVAANRLDRAEASIDLQLAHLWEDLAGLPDERTRTLAIRLMRASFAGGYFLAATEPVRGGWLKQHDYTLPEKSTP